MEDKRGGRRGAAPTDDTSGAPPFFCWEYKRMREIHLTDGVHRALVDDAISGGRGRGYVRAGRRTRDTETGERSMILMHREILDAPDSMHVDHIDGDPLNNTRQNLRLATPTENKRNQRAYRKRPDSAERHSRFKGVSWRHGKWRARISAGGRQRNLGTFPTQREAAKAYNEAAVELHGPFARLNEIGV